MPRVKSMVLVPIALIVVFIGSMQFIGWVALFCVCTAVVLDSIIHKLKGSVLYVKSYEQYSYLCGNLYFKHEVAFRCCK